MDLLQAIILGIVQGLTEFIPVSSTAHLVFASRYTGIFGGDPQKITATMAVIQLGTLLAAFVYFASDIWNISTSFLRDHFALVTGKKIDHAGKNTHRPAWMSDDTWLGWLIVIGSIPVGVIGILFKDTIEGALTKNLWIIATMLIVVAVLLQIAEFVGRQRKGLRDLGVFESLVIGCSQVLALMPGASRSGSTIMGGLFAGLSREAAARFSFLLMLPAVTASGLLELVEAWKMLPRDSFAALALGTIVAGFFGYISIWFLLAYLRRYTTTVFVVYRILLGAAILVMLWQGLTTAQV